MSNTTYDLKVHNKMFTSITYSLSDCVMFWNGIDTK